MRTKILIIDDEESFVTALKLNLEASGNFEVRIENRGSQGLNATRDFKPDMILMDIMMRDMAGPKVVESIRREADFKSTPIAYLTAAFASSDKAPGEKIISGLPVIGKPVETKSLIDFIESLIK